MFELDFDAPPAACRLLPIRHSYPTNVTCAVQQIHQLQRDGFGGAVVNVSWWRTNSILERCYLDHEALWPAFCAQVQEAQKLGLSLWLYDECGYPSGSARDLVLKEHPEFEQTGYLISCASVQGGQQVSLEIPPGYFHYARLYPLPFLLPHGFLLRKI